MSVRNLMHNTCTIQRRSETRDSYNHPVFSWTDDGYETHCRFMARVSNLRGLGGLVGEGDQTGWREVVKRIAMIILPPGTVLSEHDRIVNIKSVDGTIIDEGPFGPLLVRPVNRLRGPSHVTAVVEKVI